MAVLTIFPVIRQTDVSPMLDHSNTQWPTIHYETDW